MNINEAFPEQQPIETKPYQAAVDPLETAIAACADPETPLDRIEEIDGKIAFMKDRIAAYEKQRDAAFTERLKAMDQDSMIVGKWRYYLAMPTTQKCRSVVDTLRKFLELFDLEAIERTLSSGAFKFGQVKKELAAIGKPELFDELFETKIKEVLKGELVTGKVLSKVDTTWVK